jgi:hypothetical protein
MPPIEFMSVNGIDLRTGRPPWDGVPFDEFLRVFRDRLPYAREDEERRLATTRALSTTRSLFAAVTPNLNDPVAVGYGVITAPAQVGLLDGALAPLLDLRKVKPEHRLVFDLAAVGIGGISDWVDDHITFREGPYYWLLVGTPADIPYDLQWMLDAGKATGRIAFDADDEYRAYAERVVRADRDLAATRDGPQAFFWAPLHDRMTRLSKWYMCGLFRKSGG